MTESPSPSGEGRGGEGTLHKALQTGKKKKKDFKMDRMNAELNA